MEAYTGFAEVYDKFMDNVPYAAWAAYLKKIFARYGVTDGIVLELGCGTGTMTEQMAGAGYDMIGIDLSADMLSAAMEKKLTSGHNILYLQQDMREFELYGTVKAAYCVCDGLNYLTAPEDLEACFRLVNLYLDPGGLFVFDFNTVMEYNRGIRRIPRVETQEEDTLIWENAYDPDTRINQHRVTVFRQQADGRYEKTEELHQQRAYSLREIRTALKNAGMEYVKAYAALTGRGPNPLTRRIYVIAREHGKERADEGR